MNKREKEIQAVHLQNEETVIKNLEAVYRKASEDCSQKISDLSARKDMENLQSIIYQKQYQEAIKNQLDGILNVLQSDSFTTISDYLNTCYVNGYVGAFYDLQGQGIPLIVPIDQTQAAKAIQNDSKLSKGYYSRLGEDVSHLKRVTQVQVSRGIAAGKTWFDIAKDIQNQMTSPLAASMHNAMRIARTEGHRIQQESQYDAMSMAKERGADVVKQWCATLDDRTRETHAALDGQIREMDEPFEIQGNRAQYPGAFGIASEDINCRCCILERARWALDEDELKTLQERAAYFGLDKTKDFEDYKTKFNIAAEQIDKLDELRPLTLAGVQRGEPMTHEEADTGKANPNYSNGRGYQVNCQSCVVGYEARRRGYDVQTKANMNNPIAKKLSYHTNLAWIDPATGTSPPETRSGCKTAKQLLQYMKDNTAEGERYTLQFYWRNYNSGHIIHAYKENGEVILYDPQVPHSRDTKKGDSVLLEYFKQFKYRSYGQDVSPNLLRVDNLIIDPDIAEGIMEGSS